MSLDSAHPRNCVLEVSPGRAIVISHPTDAFIESLGAAGIAARLDDSGLLDISLMDVRSLADSLATLRDLGARFLRKTGWPWPPAAEFQYWRSQGLIEGDYMEAWQGHDGIWHELVVTADLHDLIKCVADHYYVERPTPGFVQSLTEVGVKLVDAESHPSILTPADDPALAELLTALRDCGAFFDGDSAGREFERLRDRGLINGAYMEVSWRGPGQWQSCMR